MLDDRLMDRLLAGFAGPDTRAGSTRSQRIDAVTDQLGAYTEAQAIRVVSALVDLAAVETDAECREAALHAVAEMVVWHPKTTTVARRLCGVRFSGRTRSEREYLEFLCA